MSDSGNGDDAISWERRVPLLTEPLIVGATVKAILIAVVGLATLLSAIFLVQGDADALPSIWVAMAAAGLGLVLLLLLVMLLVLGNRIHCGYHVDGCGVRYELLDRRAGAARRLAVVLGLVMRAPQQLGAGLIAESQLVQDLAWRGAFRAEFVPQRHLIVLRNAWRRMLLIHCTADNYAAVAARVAAEMTRHGTDTRVPARSPLPRYLGWSALVALATLPLFVIAEEFGVSLLLPILQLCFGLATVWLIGLFGYVMIAVDVAIAATLVRDAFTSQASWLRRGEHYTQWTVYTTQDWILLLLAIIGMALLAWIGWRAARGRFVPMLQADVDDAGQ